MVNFGPNGTSKTEYSDEELSITIHYSLNSEIVLLRGWKLPEQFNGGEADKNTDMYAK